MASIRLSCHVSESLVLLGFLIITSRFVGVGGGLGFDLGTEIVSVLRFLAAFHNGTHAFCNYSPI